LIIYITICSGLVSVVVAPETAEGALVALRAVALQAALIGDIRSGSPQVVLDTAFGGQRSLDELEDDPLPRIC
jgi:hydrogenase expression/formation protein HypE